MWDVYSFSFCDSTASNVEIELPVPSDASTPAVRTSMGTAVYAPEKEALIWKIKSFPGGKVSFVSYNRWTTMEHILWLSVGRFNLVNDMLKVLRSSISTLCYYARTHFTSSDCTGVHDESQVWTTKYWSWRNCGREATTHSSQVWDPLFYCFWNSGNFISVISIEMLTVVGSIMDLFLVMQFSQFA